MESAIKQFGKSGGFLFSFKDLAFMLCKLGIGNYGRWTQCSSLVKKVKTQLSNTDSKDPTVCWEK